MRFVQRAKGIAVTAMPGLAILAAAACARDELPSQGAQVESLPSLDFSIISKRLGEIGTGGQVVGQRIQGIWNAREKIAHFLGTQGGGLLRCMSPLRGVYGYGFGMMPVSAITGFSGRYNPGFPLPQSALLAGLKTLPWLNSKPNVEVLAFGGAETSGEAGGGVIVASDLFNVNAGPLGKLHLTVGLEWSKHVGSPVHGPVSIGILGDVPVVVGGKKVGLGIYATNSNDMGFYLDGGGDRVSGGLIFGLGWSEFNDSAAWELWTKKTLAGGCDDPSGDDHHSSSGHSTSGGTALSCPAGQMAIHAARGEAYLRPVAGASYSSPIGNGMKVYDTGVKAGNLRLVTVSDGRATINTAGALGTWRSNGGRINSQNQVQGFVDVANLRCQAH